MSGDRNQPKQYDAVLGGQNLIPVNAAVLGGIAGVKSRLTSPSPEVRIAALSAALKYGEAGLDLIIQALQDDRSSQVKLAAYLLLKDVDRAGAIESLKNSDCRFFDFEAIAVDEYGRENSRTKSCAFYFPEDLDNGIMLDMVYVPGGTFMMGSPVHEQTLSFYDRREKPQHQVTVPDFYAGKYPITQAQWQGVMGNNPSEFKGEKRPVERVSWNEAVEFCRQLSRKTGKSYRLLSEAEWEFACRAGTATPFYFGETITPDLVNYDGHHPHAKAPKGMYRNQTTDVGIFPPNKFGLYDMHGNVWEWCSDRWHANYDGAPSDGSSWETGTDCLRVLRGGSWGDFALNCRSASRENYAAELSYRFWGFRVAVAFALAS